MGSNVDCEKPGRQRLDVKYIESSRALEKPSFLFGWDAPLFLKSNAHRQKVINAARRAGRTPSDDMTQIVHQQQIWMNVPGRIKKSELDLRLKRVLFAPRETYADGRWAEN